MNVNGIDIEVEHKPIKHMHLSVYPPDGRVHLSVPQAATDAQIRLFVLSKWVWLIEKREAATSHTLEAPREYVSGEAHYFKGELYRLRVDVVPGTPQRVCLEGDYIVVQCRGRENAKGLLQHWYREQLEATLPSLVDRWCKRVEVEKPHWEVMPMTRSWGSCNKQTRHIMFNLELAKKPLGCIEYVVAHEVLHLVERTHSDRFYRLLDTYLPGWETLRQQLNEMPVSS